MAGAGKSIFEKQSFTDHKQEREFDKRYRLANTWGTQHGDRVRYHNSGEVELLAFAEWLADNGIETPTELRELVASQEGKSLARGAHQSIENEPDTFSSVPVAVAGKNPPHVWQAEARSIADRLYLRDVSLDTHDSLTNLGERIAAELRTRGIFGPHGPVTGGTVVRDAIGGKRWVPPK
jgi:hypothetical protein